VVRGSGGRRHDFMTRAGRTSPSQPEFRACCSTARPILNNELPGTALWKALSAQRASFHAFFPLRRPPRRAEKPILLPGLDNLTRSPGWITRQPEIS
jgi:hypothetical protein